MDFKPLAIAICAGLATSCASTPRVASSYYLPRANLTLTVTRTVGCGSRTEGTAPNIRSFRTLHSVVAVAPSIAYSADRDARQEVAFNGHDGLLSDSSLAVETYEDGRLKGINATSTGRAAEIIQAVAALAPILLASQGVGASEDQRNERALVEDACRAIDEAVGAGETVSLVYDLMEDFEPAGLVTGLDSAVPPQQVLDPTDQRVAQARLLRPVARGSSAADLVDPWLPPMCVYFGAPVPRPTPPVWTRSAGSQPATLGLRRLVRYDAQVFQFVPAPGQRGSLTDRTCREVDPPHRIPLWSGGFQVPLSTNASRTQFGAETTGMFELPIPRAAPFGSTEFAIALGESGAITKLQYGSTSGIAAAVGAVGAVAGVVDQSTAERAAELESQADLILQQQRLLRCQADPTKCE